MSTRTDSRACWIEMMYRFARVGSGLTASLRVQKYVPMRPVRTWPPARSA